MRKFISIPIILAFIISFLAYPRLPFQMATHWNIHGVADGFSLKPFGAYFIPVLMIVISLLLLVLPRIDPLKKNIAYFWKSYVQFILVYNAFFLYLHMLMIAWNIGLAFSFIRFLLPAFSGLFFFTGNLLTHAKRNWFIGIRTPWTLSSDAIWNKTHTLAAKLFKTAAVVTLVALLFPKLTFAIFILAILSASLIPIVYSYLLYRAK